MAQLCAITAVVILGLLAVFQAALAAGAPIGRFAWGGQHKVLPLKLRIGSVVSVVLYAVFALVILGRAGLIEVLPRVVVEVGIWVLVGYFALGILMNGISRSKAERNTMVPVTVVLTLLCLGVALLP